MPRLLAYKRTQLLAQAQQELIAQPQTRLVGYGKNIYPISLIKYGKLYIWSDLNFTKEFIEGMNVPGDADWTTLTNYINSNYNGSPNNFGTGNHLKHPRKNGTPILDSLCNTSTHPRWNANPTHYGRDTVNFSTLPGGYLFDSAFGNIGSEGYWWSATEKDIDDSWGVSMFANSGDTLRSSYDKSFGFSIRCVRAATEGEQLLDDGELIKRVQDYNENWYDCIKIGTQVWTRQNIAAMNYSDGTSATSYNYANDDSNAFFANEAVSIWEHWVNKV